MTTWLGLLGPSGVLAALVILSDCFLAPSKPQMLMPREIGDPKWRYSLKRSAYLVLQHVGQGQPELLFGI